jgi:hypothetical protein
VRGGAPDAILGADAEDVRLMPEFQKTVMGRAHAAAYHRAVAGGFAVGGYVRFLAAHAKELPVFETLDIRTDRIDDLGRYVKLQSERDGSPPRGWPPPTTAPRAYTCANRCTAIDSAMWPVGMSLP